MYEQEKIEIQTLKSYLLSQIPATPLPPNGLLLSSNSVALNAATQVAHDVEDDLVVLVDLSPDVLAEHTLESVNHARTNVFRLCRAALLLFVSF